MRCKQDATVKGKTLNRKDALEIQLAPPQKKKKKHAVHRLETIVEGLHQDREQKRNSKSGNKKKTVFNCKKFPEGRTSVKPMKVLKM